MSGQFSAHLRPLPERLRQLASRAAARAVALNDTEVAAISNALHALVEELEEAQRVEREGDTP